MENNSEDKTLLRKSLEKLISQITAYNDVVRLQYPSVTPMMTILQEMSEECLEIASSNETAPECSRKTPSKRELEVLTQVGRGLLNKEIAFTLGISIRTVEFHLKNIFAKTESQGRTEAVVYALKKGWITV